MEGFYQDEIWNVFTNLMFAQQLKKKIALVVGENIEKEKVLADIYGLLPHDYVGVPIRLVSDIEEENLYDYKYVFWQRFVGSKQIKGEYPFLKRVVLDSNLRNEFYHSKHMNVYPKRDHVMSFSDMEHAAKKFLEDKKMLTESEKDFEELKRVVLAEKEMVAELLETHRRAEKRDKRFEVFLKEILIWRNNELKIGHEVSLWKLDEILKNVGAVPFCSEKNSMYDSSQHEVVRILPCDESELTGRIVESLAQGYLFQGKVLLKEDVAVYKGGV